MATPTTARRSGARKARNTSPVEMGRSQLESSDQRKNFQRELIAMCESGRAQSATRREYGRMMEERYSDMLAEHVESRRRWLATVANPAFTPKTEAQFAEQHRLRNRYGGPSADDVHIDTLTSETLIDFPQSEFIGPLAVPFDTVSKRSGKIQQLDRRAGRHTGFDDLRAPGTPAKEMSFDIGSSVSYDIEARGLQLPIPDEVVENEDDPIRVAELSARYVREIVLLKHEKRIATLLTTAANFDSNHRITAPSTKWDNTDRTDEEHLDDIHSAQDKMRTAVGRMPNLVIMNFPTVQALIRKTDFRDRVKYVDRIMDGTLLGLVAAYCGVDEALIGMATEDTANIGAAASYADVWPDDVVFLRVEGGGIGTVNFALAPVTDMGTVLNWRAADPTARTDKTAFLLDVDEVVTQDTAGVHIDDVLT